MATVTITITDSPHGVIVVTESKNPKIPMNGRDPDTQNLTDAQAVGIGAMMAICDQVGEVDFRVLLVDD